MECGRSCYGHWQFLVSARYHFNQALNVNIETGPGTVYRDPHLPLIIGYIDLILSLNISQFAINFSLAKGWGDV